MAPDPYVSTVDVDGFKQAVGRFATGVVVVTGAGPDGPVGITCQSFVSLSLDPLLVSFAPTRTSYSWEQIRVAGHFCVNILDVDQEETCMTFATPRDDRFSEVDWRPSPSGAPILDGVLSWIDCRVDAVHEAGDHDVVVGAVLDLGGRDEAEAQSPLVHFRGGFGRFEPTP